MSEVKGKITKIFEEEEIQGKEKKFKKQFFTIETPGEYPKTIAFEAFGEKVEILKFVKVGDQVNVHFNLDSKEFNNKFYHNVRVWKIENLSTTADNSKEPSLPENKEEDDLPF